MRTAARDSSGCRSSRRPPCNHRHRRPSAAAAHRPAARHRRRPHTPSPAPLPARYVRRPGTGARLGRSAGPRLLPEPAPAAAHACLPRCPHWAGEHRGRCRHHHQSQLLPTSPRHCTQHQGTGARPVRPAGPRLLDQACCTPRRAPAWRIACGPGRGHTRGAPLGRRSACLQCVRWACGAGVRGVPQMPRPSPRCHAERAAGPQRPAAELAYTAVVAGQPARGPGAVAGPRRIRRRVHRVTVERAAGRRRHRAAAGARAQPPPSAAP